MGKSVEYQVNNDELIGMKLAIECVVMISFAIRDLSAQRPAGVVIH